MFSAKSAKDDKGKRIQGARPTTTTALRSMFLELSAMVKPVRTDMFIQSLQPNHMRVDSTDSSMSHNALEFSSLCNKLQERMMVESLLIVILSWLYSSKLFMVASNSRE